MEPVKNIPAEPFAIDMPKGIETVLNTLQKAGYQAVLAGGCVRDALKGDRPHDFDIATSARPEEVMALFEKTIPTGARHGTVTVVQDGEMAEVTTFRKEGGYSDHRHPDAVEFVEDLKEDLARRDFTINAMAWSPATGLVDPFGGQEDLKKGIVRAVGDPEKRFEEDALRMFRAFRFAGRYGFEIEPKTRKAIDDKAPLAGEIAVERVVPEMEAIMKDSPQIIADMTELLKPWIPQLAIMKETEQNSIWHYTDVLHHTLDALQALPKWDPESGWAVLLHDAGKPETKQFYGGHDHFKNHASASARIARQVVKDLKLPKKSGEEIVNLVKLHDTFYAPKLINLYKLRVKHGLSDESVQKLFNVQEADIQAHTTKDRMQALNAFRDFYEREKNRHPLSLKELKINGEDVLAKTDLKGREIAEVLERVLKEVILHPDLNSREGELQLLEKEAAALKREQKNPKAKKASR